MEESTQTVQTQQEPGAAKPPRRQRRAKPMKDQEPSPFVTEARLKFKYRDPITKNLVMHKRATFRMQDGEEVCTGGSQIYSTGAGGGPGVELKFDGWTEIPVDVHGQSNVLQHLRTDPDELARVEVRRRPRVVPEAAMLDAGIPTLTVEEYLAECRKEMASAKGKPARP